MKKFLKFSIVFIFLVFLSLFFASSAFAASLDCTTCHGTKVADFNYPNVPRVDRLTVCWKCHNDAMGLGIYLTESGWFASLGSPSSGPEVIHPSHAGNNIYGGANYQFTRCGTCHGPVDCNACHTWGSTLSQVPHASHPSARYSPLSHSVSDSITRSYKDFYCTRVECHTTWTTIVTKRPDGTDLCLNCHTDDKSAGQHIILHAPNPTLVGTTCISCHQNNLPNEHTARGYDCQACHTSNPITPTQLNAQQAIQNYKLTGIKAGCSTCHVNIPPDLGNAHVELHDNEFPVGTVNCGDCHLPSRTRQSAHWPNLQDLHISKPTTTYPSGMDCNSCHNYVGSKLSRTSIDNAIASGNKNCSACHTVHEGNANLQHSVNLTQLQLKYGFDCSTCHQMNLQNQHIAMSTTTYPAGMDCNGCHNYTGTKLDQSKIKLAISLKNTQCDSCHTIHVNPEPAHDTIFIDNPPLDCISCHQITSPNTNNPNLWVQHIGKSTTSYPQGMDCNSCHKYTGLKLDPNNIRQAISGGNTKCSGCHTIHQGDAIDMHVTDFMGNPSDCTTCHTPSRPSQSPNHNLQDLHISKPTTTYPSGMDCNSCHNYQGTKLNPTDIKMAIAIKNTRCNACHKSVDAGGHEAVHGTSFDSAVLTAIGLCSSCHISDPGQQPPYTLWNVHLGKQSTGYSKMDCNTCHNYSGSKLNKSTIESAINGGNTDCKSCHAPIGSHALTQSTTLPSSVHTGKPCDTCHPRASATVASPTSPNSSLSTIPGDNICFGCHKSGGTAPDVQTAFSKPYRHKLPKCAGCHEPHRADKSTAQAPAADGALIGTSGVAVANGPAGTSPTFTLLASVNNQYELCFKCHSSYAGTLPAGTQDKAIEFNTNNPSYHPVEDTGKNLGIKDESFKLGTPWNPTSGDDPDYSANSTKVYCTDCHGSDTSIEPEGPHGSNNSSILKANFSKVSWSKKMGLTTNIAVDNALCFTCHEYNVYYGRATGSRMSYHRYHVQGKGNNCYACHDTHGRSDKPHLIRILSSSERYGIRDLTHTSSGGTCYPSCHGSKNYSHAYPETYVAPPPPGEAPIYADQALWIQKLYSPTDADDKGSISDITSYMKDDKFDKYYDVQNKWWDNRVVTLKFNQDSSKYSKVVLKIYVNSIDSAPDTTRIYAYNSDGKIVKTGSYKDYSVNTTGWLEFDITSVAGSMNSYGWMKFRVTSTDIRFRVSEAQAILTAK